MGDNEIAFFVKHIKSLPPRKTHKPGTYYESYIANAEYTVLPDRDAIIIDWNYYRAVISLFKGQKDCNDWGVEGDCKYHVFIESPGVAGNHFCTVFSSGGYKTKEACWRGLIARMRRERK